MFPALVPGVTFPCGIKIDFPAIEIRAIDASELPLASDPDTAASAPSGAIDPNRVPRDNSLDIVFLCQDSNVLPPDDRSDGDNFIELIAFFLTTKDFFLESLRDKALFTPGSVIAPLDEDGRAILEVLFEND